MAKRHLSILLLQLDIFIINTVQAWPPTNCHAWPPVGFLAASGNGQKRNGTISDVTFIQTTDTFHNSIVLFNELHLVESDKIVIVNTLVGSNGLDTQFIDVIAPELKVHYPPFIQSLNGSLKLTFTTNFIKPWNRILNISICSSPYYNLDMENLTNDQNPVQGLLNTQSNYNPNIPYMKILSLSGNDLNYENSEIAIVNHGFELGGNNDYVSFYLRSSSMNICHSSRFLYGGMQVPRFQKFKGDSLLVVIYRMPEPNHGGRQLATLTEGETSWNFEFAIVDDFYSETIDSSSTPARSFTCHYHPTLFVYTESNSTRSSAQFVATNTKYMDNQFICRVHEGWLPGRLVTIEGLTLRYKSSVGVPSFDWDKPEHKVGWPRQVASCRSTMTIQCYLDGCSPWEEPQPVVQMDITLKQVLSDFRLPKLINLLNDNTTAPSGSLVLRESYGCPNDFINVSSHAFKISVSHNNFIEMSIDNVDLQDVDIQIYDGISLGYEDSLVKRIHGKKNRADWFGVLPRFCTNMAEIHINNLLSDEDIGILLNYKSQIYKDNQNDHCGNVFTSFAANTNLQIRTPQYPCNQCNQMMVQASTNDGWFLHLQFTDSYLRAKGDVVITRPEDSAIIYNFNPANTSSFGIVDMHLCSNEIRMDYNSENKEAYLRQGIASQWEAYLPQSTREECNFWTADYCERIMFDQLPSPANSSYLIRIPCNGFSIQIEFDNIIRFSEKFATMEIYVIKKDSLKNFIPQKFTIWEYPNQAQSMKLKGKMPSIDVRDFYSAFMKITNNMTSNNLDYIATIDSEPSDSGKRTINIELQPSYTFELISPNYPFPPPNDTAYIYRIVMSDSCGISVNVTNFYIPDQSRSSVQLCEAVGQDDDRCQLDSEKGWKQTGFLDPRDRVGKYSMLNPIIRLHPGKFPAYNGYQAQGFQIFIHTVDCPGYDISTAISLAIVILIVLVVGIACLTHLHQRSRSRRRLAQQSTAQSNAAMNTSSPPDPAQRNAWLSPTDAMLLQQYALSSNASDENSIPPPPNYDEYLSKSYEVLPSSASFPNFVPPYFETSLDNQSISANLSTSAVAEQHAAATPITGTQDSDNGNQQITRSMITSEDEAQSTGVECGPIQSTANDDTADRCSVEIPSRSEMDVGIQNCSPHENAGLMFDHQDSRSHEDLSSDDNDQN